MSLIGKGVFVQNNAVLDAILDGSISGRYVNNRITNLHSSAFVSRASITSVEMNNVISIGNYAFSGCSNLASVSFASATDVNTYAFNLCSSLTRIDLPSVTSIGAYAFSRCTNLSTVVLSERAALDNVNAFNSCPAIIYVEADDLSWYSTATNWSVLYGQGRVKSKAELEG